MGKIASRTDANQNLIVRSLRQNGATVTLLHTVGQGCPDLLVGINGRNILLEIKTATGKLTPQQLDWHRDWRGQIFVVRSVQDAHEAVNGKSLVAVLNGIWNK